SCRSGLGRREAAAVGEAIDLIGMRQTRRGRSARGTPLVVGLSAGCASTRSGVTVPRPTDRPACHRSKEFSAGPRGDLCGGITMKLAKTLVLGTTLLASL